jgi:hypothetical protein
MALTMKMEKDIMVKATESMREEGQRLVLKRDELIQFCIRTFIGKGSKRLLAKKDEILHDTDSFPNYWFGDLNKEKKENLIKINTWYFIGIGTLVKGNRELEKLIAKNQKEKGVLPNLRTDFDRAMAGIEEKNQNS